MPLTRRGFLGALGLGAVGSLSTVALAGKSNSPLAGKSNSPLIREWDDVLEGMPVHFIEISAKHDNPTVLFNHHEMRRVHIPTVSLEALRKDCGLHPGSVADTLWERMNQIRLLGPAPAWGLVLIIHCPKETVFGVASTYVKLTTKEMLLSSPVR